jgi:uncharacterized repeat protein (TIGR03803 family)
VKGTLYGTSTEGGKYNYGIVFSISPSGKLHILHSFAGAPNDGEAPEGSLAVLNGVLYGTTTTAARSATGSCSASPKPVRSRSGEEKVIHSFGSGTDGQVPEYGGDALAVHDGELYGTTELGGKSAMGTVFGISTAGKERVLYSFGAFPAGREPYGGVTPVKDTLFGTTTTGGSEYEGTAFALTL